MKFEKYFLSIFIIASILLISSSQLQDTFSDTNPDNQKTQSNKLMPNGMKSVNDITIRAIFETREGTIDIESFGYFKQISGFDRTKPVQFMLEGIVDKEKDLLYQAADYYYAMQNDQANKFADSDIKIILEQHDKPIRKFSYANCRIINYYVTTYYDTLFSYQQGEGIALVDSFTFDCKGYKPYSPYEMNGHKKPETDLKKETK